MTPVKLMMQGQASKPGTPAPSSSAHSSQQLTDAARSHRDALLAPPLTTPGALMQSHGPPVLQPGCLIDVALAGRLFMGAGFPQTTRASITRILSEQSFEVCVCACACVCESVSCGVLCVHARSQYVCSVPAGCQSAWIMGATLVTAQLCLALAQVHSPAVHPGWTITLFVSEEHHLWKRVGKCAARHSVRVHLCATACAWVYMHEQEQCIAPAPILLHC